jgi:hypothetical protein
MINTRDNAFCYENGEYITKCKDQYNINCPRICKLWLKEQGESQGIERLFTLQELQNGTNNRNNS